MTQDLNFFKKKLSDICVLLVTFKILSHYPNIEILEKTLIGSQTEFSQKKTHSLNGFKISSRTFLLNFWFLPLFDVFIVIRLILMSY